MKSSTCESTQHLELFFFYAYPGILLLWLQTIKTWQFHGNDLIHPATKQLFPNHFMANAEKAIICKTHWDKQRRLLVASQSGSQSSHACLITLRAEWINITPITYSWHTNWETGVHDSFIPSWVSDTFKHSLLHLAIYCQNLQAVEIITQINEACLPFTEKQNLRGQRKLSLGGTNSAPFP